MAIYHLSAKMINRSDGRSSTAAAAYRAGCEIVDARTGEVHDYTKKRGVVHAEIITPEYSPSWANERVQLWNYVELAEKRKDAQLAREIEIALPVELSLDDHKEMIMAFARKQFVSKGMIADVAIHYPEKGTAENPHAHIMLTTREITHDGFGKKNRDWNDKALLEEWRSEWARYANHGLKRRGIDERIDHRSLKEQGIDREPTIKMGAAATQMERRGIQTDRGDLNRLILFANEMRQELTEEIKELYQKAKKTAYSLKKEWQEFNKLFETKNAKTERTKEQTKAPEKVQDEWAKWNAFFAGETTQEPEKTKDKERSRDDDFELGR